MWSCVLANDVALFVEWPQLLLSPSHSNILNVTRPQTNSDSVCVSLCAGQVLFDTVYLLELALQQNVRQDRKFQAQRLAVLVPDAWSCGQSSVYGATKYATQTVIM